MARKYPGSALYNDANSKVVEFGMALSELS